MPEEPIKVLLVEDSPTYALLVRSMLAADSSGSFCVTTTDRLDAAIARAHAEPFDVMLLDLVLPDAQGLETFQRAHAALPSIPIVVMTGLGDDALAMDMIQRGAQDYLPKARVMDGIVPRAIRYAIERNRARMEREHYAAELEKNNRELEDELRMARDIQQALLPHSYPRFLRDALHFDHCYRPAAMLSGDFFNVLRLSETKAGVLICDVMGHGVRAALIGALARGLVDQSMPVANRPGEFLSEINRELAGILKQTGIDAFASAFYCVMDLSERHLTYANAGHPSGLVMRRDAGAVDWLGGNGKGTSPLGLIGDVAYPAFETALAPHDSVLLFTDGLFEAENAAGEEFGRKRLFDAVSRRLNSPCDQLLGELIGESQRFSGHEDFTDDVCLVVADVVNSIGMN